MAEAWRNITAVGGQPLAITDNLNFGNPERPDAMGQFVGCLKGIGEACLALDFPVVSGNVSLYNETNGRGILPTPTIGGVGVLPDVTRFASLAFKQAGDMIVLPAGCLHRFSPDAGDRVDATRLFVGEPVWTPIARGQPADEHPARRDYVQRTFGTAAA